MRSSTSSSDIRFIAAIFGCALVIFAALNGAFLAGWLGGEKLSPRPDPLRYNETVLQALALEPERWREVVVGSSAASFVPPPGTGPADQLTLAIQAGSAVLGLEALVETGARPERVYVEASLTDRPVDFTLLHEQLSWETALAQRVPALQVRNNLLSLAAKFWDRQYYTSNTRPNALTPDRKWEDVEPSAARRASLYLGAGAQSISEEEEYLSGRLMDIIIRDIATLRERGAEIVFYVPPLHPILLKSPEYNAFPARLREQFPDDPWVTFCAGDLVTSDGIHPTPMSGYRMFKTLEHTVESPGLECAEVVDPAEDGLDGLSVALELEEAEPISETYREKFAVCDRENRFDDIPIGGDTRCAANPSNLSRLVRIENAVILTSRLGVRLDGSSACSPSPPDEDCATRLTLPDSGSLNSDTVPYVALPLPSGPLGGFRREFYDLTGVNSGDFGVVVYADRVVPVIVGDSELFYSIAGGSLALHRALGLEPCARRHGQGCVPDRAYFAPNRGVTTIIFPDSRIDNLSADEINEMICERGAGLWAGLAPQVGGEDLAVQCVEGAPGAR